MAMATAAAAAAAAEDRSPPCKRPALRDVTSYKTNTGVNNHVRPRMANRHAPACSLLSLPVPVARPAPSAPAAVFAADDNLDLQLDALALRDPPPPFIGTHMHDPPPPFIGTRTAVLDAAAVQASKRSGDTWRDLYFLPLQLQQQAAAERLSLRVVAVDAVPLPGCLHQRGQDQLQRLADAERRCSLPGPLGSVAVQGTVGKGAFGYTLLAELAEVARGRSGRGGPGRLVVLKVSTR